MSRLLLVSVPPPGLPPAEDAATAAGSLEHAPARLGRALRDAGHEVVLAGEASTGAVVAAVAVQEDVEAVVLLAPATYDAGTLARELGAEVALVRVTADEQPGEVVERVAAQVGAG